MRGRRRKDHIIVSMWRAIVETPRGPITFLATSERALRAKVEAKFGVGTRVEPQAAQFQSRFWVPNISDEGGIVMSRERVSASTRAEVVDKKEHRRWQAANDV